MIKQIILIAVLALTGCDSGNSGSGSGGGGVAGSMANGLATGVGAGIGAAAGTHAINAGVDKWKKHKEAKNAAKAEPKRHEKEINPRPRVSRQPRSMSRTYARR